MIQLSNDAGDISFAFPIQLISELAAMSDTDAAGNIYEEAQMWVSENEGYNSIEYDRLCEQMEEKIWEQVYAHRELTSTFEGR